MESNNNSALIQKIENYNNFYNKSNGSDRKMREYERSILEQITANDIDKMYNALASLFYKMNERRDEQVTVRNFFLCGLPFPSFSTFLKKYKSINDKYTNNAEKMVLSLLSEKWPKSSVMSSVQESVKQLANKKLEERKRAGQSMEQFG